MTVIKKNIKKGFSALLKHYVSLLPFLLSFLIPNATFSQDFLHEIDKIKSIQADSDNYYFKEIWIHSKDINKDDPQGLLRRASDKIGLGYYKEALEDVNKTIILDSAISYSYGLKGLIMLKCDSVRSALENFNKAISLNDTDKYNFIYAAQVYMILGKLEAADSLLHRAVELDGSFVNGYFGLGNLNIMKRNYKVAEENYKKVLNLNPDFSLAYFNLAIIYFATDPSEARRNLEKTVEISPKFAHAYYVLGYLEMRQGKNNAAIHNWTRAVELEPQNLLYHVVLGLTNINTSNQEDGFKEIFKVMGNPKIRSFIEDFQKLFSDKHASDFLCLVLSYYENSVSLSNSEDKELRKALCYFYQGKYSAADKIFRERAISSSAPGLIFYLQGFNYEYYQKPELSLTSYNASIKQSVFPSEAYLRQGIILHLLGKFREAVKPLSVYTEINDSSKVAFLLKGSAFLNISEFDSAICSFNNLLKLDSNQLDGYFNRACCFKQKEMYLEAMNDFDKVVKYRIFDLESIGLLAECRYLSGDTTGALTLLDESILEFHVLDENGFYLRGTINLWRMQYDSAIFNFNKVVEFQNHHDDVLTMRGLAYYCKTDYQNAKTDLNSAIDFNNNDITAIFTLGMVNLKLNELDDAYFNLKKAESLGHPLAGKSLKLYLKDYKPPAKNQRK